MQPLACLRHVADLLHADEYGTPEKLRAVGQLGRPPPKGAEPILRGPPITVSSSRLVLRVNREWHRPAHPPMPQLDIRGRRSDRHRFLVCSEVVREHIPGMRSRLSVSPFTRTSWFWSSRGAEWGRMRRKGTGAMSGIAGMSRDRS